VTQPSDPAAPPSPTGPFTRVVVPGDHVVKIAVSHGLRRIATIWDDPANAELKQERVNPHTLAPGDRVVVPVLEPFEASKATDTTHRLVVSATGLLLNIRLEGFERQPLKNRFYQLVVGERDLTGPGAIPSVPVTGKTDAKGELSEPIPENAALGELTVHEGDTEDTPLEVKFRLLIGLLPPANTVRGLQIRLNNMGYFAGFDEKDTEQLRWAVEEFEHDHGIEEKGKFDDPKTINKIAHEHGDLLPSEKVP
jgi:hypothetical protein